MIPGGAQGMAQQPAVCRRAAAAGWGDVVSAALRGQRATVRDRCAGAGAEHSDVFDPEMCIRDSRYLW